MLNPFTKDQISLPPMSTLPNVIAYHPEKHDEEYTITDRFYRVGADFPCVRSKSEMQKCYFIKVIISSSPQDQGIMAMIIYGICRRLAYCKLGDKKWTGVGTDPMPGYRDALFCGGKIYAVNAVQFFEIDIESGEVIKVQLPHAAMENFEPRRNFLYVVGTPDGLIMVIIRRVGSYCLHRYGKTHGFDIYKKLNDKEGEWSIVNDLGDYVLMVGYNNTSVCLLPHAFPGGKGNRIYYTDDYVQGHSTAANYDIGYFTMEDKTTHQLFPRSLNCINSDSVPIAFVWFIYKAT